MKSRKASRSTGVVVEILRTEGCLESLTRIFNEALFESKLLDNWMLNSLVSIYKGKGDPLNTISYRHIKLLEHAFNLYEWILDKRLREIVDIQCGFTYGRGTIDALFIFRRLTEKYCSKAKKLFHVFVDLEKLFDYHSK